MLVLLFPQALQNAFHHLHMVQKRHFYAAQCIYTEKNKKLRTSLDHFVFSVLTCMRRDAWATPSSTSYKYSTPSPTPKGLGKREVPQERLSPQVTSFSAQNPLSFPCPLAYSVKLGEKIVAVSGCFAKGGEKFQSRQETPCCNEASLVTRAHPLMDRDWDANYYTYTYIYI